jgi:UDP-N-acetylglucosamine 4,6-dehydratase
VDVVIHAAALKRIEVGHYNPIEMVRTNIEGAINVTEAARDAGVKKVVALSTDKAFQPVSPYGQSKALAERIFLSASTPRGTKFAVTRYGNVWGSAGSVLPIWRAILASGSRSVPVTDPDCTRFFMLMREALDLVHRTVDTMTGNETEPIIPELPAFRLGDLVRALGAEPNVIGLPEWEKMHESMREERCSKDARRMSVDELRAAAERLT